MTQDIFSQTAIAKDQLSVWFPKLNGVACFQQKQEVKQIEALTGDVHISQ